MGRPLWEDHLQEENSESIARRWLAANHPEWTISDVAGVGGTAPVFGIQAEAQSLALKIYDEKFSGGALGVVEEARIAKQLELGNHKCPYIVKFLDGGRFEDRLFLVMTRAPGKELRKVLADVPRFKIRSIVDQIARACIFLRERNLCHRDIKSENIFISDDFGHATLLDLSVIRDIDDPIGLGTDQDGQLPIVATARYSPPEYLFRLIPAGEELWHALDIYQLGGLLHDLIMREPLFERQFRASQSNRYRFAWIVATQSPDVNAFDVDRDLLLRARRALDKDWQTRSQLRLQDFLAEKKAREEGAMSLLGFGSAVADSPGAKNTDSRRRLLEVSRLLDEFLVLFFRSQGVTPVHEQFAGASDLARKLRLSWNGGQFVLTVDLIGQEKYGKLQIESHLQLRASWEDSEREHRISLPACECNQSEEASEHLGQQITTCIGELAEAVARASE